jgi:hypothetical protein
MITMKTLVLLCVVSWVVTGCSTEPQSEISRAPNHAPTSQSISEFIDLVHFDEVMGHALDAYKEMAERRFVQMRTKSSLTPAQAALVDEFKRKALSTFDELLAQTPVRHVLEVTIRGSFSQRDIDALNAFYRTQSGRGIVDQWEKSIGAFVKERQTRNLSSSISSEPATRELPIPVTRIFSMAADSHEIAQLYGNDIDEDILSRLPRAETIYDAQIDKIEAEVHTRIRALMEEYRTKMKDLAKQ